MIFKAYDQNDKSLTESIKLAGLSEYKAQKLIRFANENKVNIQKAYLLTELLVLFLIFGLLFFVIELTCRLHKNYLKVWKVYIKLRGI